MSKPTNAVKDRWNAKAYDDLRVRIPKGRKAEVEAYALSKGESVNGLINAFFRDSLGMSEEDWKHTTDNTGGT